jgi:hypothetical protein
MWRSDALAAAQRAAAEAAPVRELWRRARLAAEHAERALEPDTPLADGPGHALAISLYREAAFWALSASRSSPPSQGRSLGDLLSSNAEALGESGLSESDLARVRAVLAEQSFIETAALDRSRQIADAELSRSFVNALLEQAGAASEGRHAIARVHVQRAWRTAAVLIACAALVFCAALAIVRAVRGPDLAFGKPWIASSKWAECHPEHLQCGPLRTRIFFHTKLEMEPWLLIDLGPGTTFGRVEVVNREDCCKKWPLPLVVEVSDDEQTFREVARRTQPFDIWHATFPAVKARYVRLRVDARAYFHLTRVSVRRS